jgi:hypothetical protein
MILANVYHMDDSYSNKSWSIASKGLFSLREVNEMEIEMLEYLDFKIGEDGVKSIVDIIESYEAQFVEWAEEMRSGRNPSKTLSVPEIESRNEWMTSESPVEIMTSTSSFSSSSSSPSSSSSSSSASLKSKKTNHHSIWNLFRPKCNKSQSFPALGSFVSVH